MKRKEREYIPQKWKKRMKEGKNAVVLSFDTCKKKKLSEIRLPRISLKYYQIMTFSLSVKCRVTMTQRTLDFFEFTTSAPVQAPVDRKSEKAKSRATVDVCKEYSKWNNSWTQSTHDVSMNQ